LDHRRERRAGVLIDCDTCTVRGEGCADCVVTVLLGAPPGWQDGGPVVVPLTRRRPDRTGSQPATRGADTPDAPERVAASCDLPHLDSDTTVARAVVELDDVERRAVRALAEFGLVPPLRHQDASPPPTTRHREGDRHVS
jgi:hypothetical protein